VVKGIEIEALGSLCKSMRKTVVDLIRGHGRGNAPENLSAGHRLEYMEGPAWLDGISSLKDATVADNHGDFGHGYAQMAQQVGGPNFRSTTSRGLRKTFLVIMAFCTNSFESISE
jgi:hypothetical protein